MTITDTSIPNTGVQISPRKSETARINRYNPTEPSRFARVIPAPAYAHCPKNNRVSRRAIHRAEVAARKAGVL